MASRNLLNLESVSKAFDIRPLLDAVSLGINEGERIGIVGRNGGGKSTLLRIIAGLEIPDSGGVEINGDRLQFQEASLLEHRRGIGTVFQAYNLFPHLTALKNITLPLEKVHGQSAAAARETAMQILKRLRLESHANKRPAELSGGQRQRIAIARAIAIKGRARLYFGDPRNGICTPHRGSCGLACRWPHR